MYVYVNMYVCVYASVDVYVHVYTSRHVYSSVSVFVSMSRYVYVYVHVYEYVYQGSCPGPVGLPVGESKLYELGETISFRLCFEDRFAVTASWQKRCPRTVCGQRFRSRYVTDRRS